MNLVSFRQILVSITNIQVPPFLAILRDLLTLSIIENQLSRCATPKLTQLLLGAAAFALSIEINAQFPCFFGELLLTPQLELYGGIVQAPTLMQEFVLGQKWTMADPVFGTFFGEVIEVSEDGTLGTVLISDDQGNEVDTFTGTVAEFQASGEWRLLEA